MRQLGEELDSREIALTRAHQRIEYLERELANQTAVLAEGNSKQNALERTLRSAEDEANRLRTGLSSKEKHFQVSNFLF